MWPVVRMLLGYSRLSFASPGDGVDKNRQEQYQARDHKFDARAEA